MPRGSFGETIDDFVLPWAGRESSVSYGSKAATQALSSTSTQFALSSCPGCFPKRRAEHRETAATNFFGFCLTAAIAKNSANFQIATDRPCTCSLEHADSSMA